VVIDYNAADVIHWTGSFLSLEATGFLFLPERWLSLRMPGGRQPVGSVLIGMMRAVCRHVHACIARGARGGAAMSTNIYIGNLPFSATENEIRDLFSAYGTVESVRLMTDRETGRPRGFGFVVMASGGKEAIAALNEKELSGRNIVVNEARPREDRPRRERRW
jgi:hypothetical protein